MKSIKELLDTREKYDKLFEEYSNSKELNDYEKKEKRVISGHWVDFINYLLDFNICEYMEKYGYTDDDIAEIISFDNPEIVKELVITEEQAKKELEYRIEYCKKHPYGVTYNNLFGGIFLQKLEADILKWYLDVA